MREAPYTKLRLRLIGVTMLVAIGPLLVWTIPVWSFRSGRQRATGWR